MSGGELMTKDNITIAALRLFLSRGYKCVSLVDVAKEVGITKGGVYHYFTSKEELLHSAIHYLFDRFESKYIELFSGNKSLQEILNSIMVQQEMDLYIRELLDIEVGDYRLNYASFALEIIYNFPEMQERIDNWHWCFCGLVEQKVQNSLNLGEIRADLDSRGLAIMILSMCNGRNSLGLQLNNRANRQKMMDNFWKIISG